MKRVVILALLLALAGSANAELLTQSITATTTSTPLTVNSSEVFIKNDSTSISIHVRLFMRGETAGAATSSYFEIKFGEAFTFTRTAQITSIAIIAASSTAAVRVAYWQ